MTKPVVHGHALQSSLAVFAACMATAGCEVLGVDCTTEFRFGITVEVVDSVSGARILDPIVRVRDGGYEETLAVWQGFAQGAGERPGTYEVRVEHDDYEPWLRSGVRVTEDECHVRTQDLTARLQPSDEPPAERPEWPAGFLVGGDVSALGRIEQGGAQFSVDGTEMDAIEALTASGANVFRLRLFVDPSGEEVQVNDLPYTIALAERVVAAGATLLLDFHYSDTWADPSHQTLPAAWADLDFDSLEATVEAYSRDVIAAMKDAGVLPDIVQIGNEIDAGLLWPHGRIGGSYDQPEDFERFGRLLKAGIRGVRAALEPGDDVRIMLQYSQGASIGGTRWFFDRVAEQGVDFDIIGLSYYPWWHGTLSNLTINLHDVAARYAKDVMVVELNYPWRTGWTPLNARADWQAWPLTPEGQADFLRDVVDAVAATSDERGLGVVWWYPEAIQVPGLFVWGGGALALFDGSGEALPAVEVFSGN